MDLLVIFIIAMGLAMDCFTISISNSSISGLVKPGISLKVSIAFAFAHLVALVLGYQLGGLVQNMFQGLEQWAAFMILGIVGIKMIMEVRRRHPSTKVFDINQTKVIVVLSLATAMDAFLAGVAMGVVRLGLVLPSVMVTLIVFIFTIAGMAGGSQLGLAYAKKTAYFGGSFMLMASALFLVAQFI